VPVWENNGYNNDFQWTQVQHALHDNYSRAREFRIRFQLGPTDGQNNYSGWNIDDVFLTGEFISKDAGVTEWISPVSGCGHTDSETVVVRIRNFGGAEISGPFPVGYSFDGGSTWTIDTCNDIIPVDGSVIFAFPTTADLSEPGLRPEVIVKTMLPGDQTPGNDHLSTQLFIIPTISVPYAEEFEDGNGYWYTTPGGIWAYGAPEGNVINSAASGNNSWVTGLSQKYGNLISQFGQVIFEDDFEMPRGWSFTGEFERNIPSALPYFAYSGVYCIGTDLSGQGATPYMYEKGIGTATAYNATTPAFDVSAYSSLKVSFIRWLNINQGDSVRLEVSPDNGGAWHTVWKNSEGGIWDEDWDIFVYDIHDSLSYSTQMKFRFSLYHSAAGGDPAAGMNIDDFVLTGDLVNTASFSLNSPCFDLAGMTNPVFEAKIWVDTEQDVDGAALNYSLDGGLTWLHVSNASGFDEYWNWYTGHPVSALGTDGWSGHSGGWIRVRHLLPPELLGIERVQFRLNFRADFLNNNFDGIALDDINIYEAPHDAGVASILSPVSDCELEPDQKFTLRIRNYGLRDMQAGDTLRIGYHISRSGEIQTAEETIILSGTFPAGSTSDFSMNTEFDFGVSGEYHVDVYTIEDDPLFYGPSSNDSVYALILAAKPEFSLGRDIYTVRPDTLVLNAFAGAGHDYLWQDNSTDSVYHVSIEGTYSVRVTNHLGCFATDAVNIFRLIADVGVNEIISPVSSCELDNLVPVTISVENFGTDTLSINDSIYLFGELNGLDFFNDTLILSENFYPGTNLEFTFSRDFDFSMPGIYNLKVYTKLTDDLNTGNDTLELDLHVFGYPEIDLGPDREINATELILDPGPGFSEYLWQDGSQEQHFSVKKPGQEIYWVRVTDVNSCSVSDTVQITLNVLDIAVDRILSPGTSCLLSDNIEVSARIRNTGNLSISSGEKILIGFGVDGGPIVEGEIILSEDFHAGDSIDYIFSETVVVELGSWYDFSVIVNYPGDMNSTNDTILMSVGIFSTPEVDIGPAFHVISALEYILDAGEGFASYLWHDGSTDQTFLLNTPGINTVSVTVTDHIGCTAFDQTQILLVVPDIGVIEISHPVTSCMLGEQENIKVAIKNYGNSNMSASAGIKVAYSVNGSAPVVENVVLTGTFGAGHIIYHTFSGTTGFNIPGSYSITAYTIFAADLVPSNDSKTVEIEILGKPIVDIGGGQDTLVVFDQITLSVIPGYTSYLWQDGSTANTFTIDEPGAGMYVVIVTDDNGCSTADSVFVAYDVPDIGINRIISPESSCKPDAPGTISIEIINNGFYRLSATDVITITYSVNNAPPVTEVRTLGNALPPGGLLTIGFDAKYDFSGTGNYDLTVIVEFEGDQDSSNNEISAEVEIWAYPVVDIGAGYDLINTSLPYLLDAGEGFFSYLWQDSSAGSTFNVTQYGLYWVTVSNEFGCTTSDTVYVDSPVGIVKPAFQPGQIRIYPNPVDDILNILIETDLIRDYTIELFTVQNKLVYKELFKKTFVVEGRINVGKFAPGTYLLRVIFDDTMVSYKIIVK
jgi:hypothetical protein